MTADMPRWMMGDPALVHERLEAQEQAKAARAPEVKREQSKTELEELFKEHPGEQK